MGPRFPGSLTATHSVLPSGGLPGGLEGGPWEVAAGQRRPALPPLASPHQSLSSHPLAAAVTPPAASKGLSSLLHVGLRRFNLKDVCSESKHRNPPVALVFAVRGQLVPSLEGP